MSTRFSKGKFQRGKGCPQEGVLFATHLSHVFMGFERISHRRTAFRKRVMTVTTCTSLSNSGMLLCLGVDANELGVWLGPPL